ncbi:MAG: hypothetical protein ABIT96_07600, partial [Ferruginibacter sp.]
PDSFPVKACNIARAMTEDSYQLGVISVMIKNNKTPKNILLSLWPANYVLDYKKDEAPEDVLFLKYYYNQVPYVKRQVNKISRFENLKYLFASYKFNSKIFDILKYYRISHDEKNKDYYFTYEHGVAMDTTRLNILPSSTKTSARDGQFPLSAYSTKFLPALADTCKKYGINLMCYYMPRFYTDTVRIKQGLDFIRQTMQQKNVPYFEFSPSDNPEFFEHKSWWADGLHLNEEGGKLQSSILSRFASPYIKR